MVDGNGGELNSTNQHGSAQRHRALLLQDRQTSKQSPRRRSRVDRTGSAIDEARRMVGMRMREDNRIRRDSVKSMQPVRAAIDHDADIVLLNKQRAVTPMLARADLDVAARP